MVTFPQVSKFPVKKFISKEEIKKIPPSSVQVIYVHKEDSNEKNSTKNLIYAIALVYVLCKFNLVPKDLHDAGKNIKKDVVTSTVGAVQMVSSSIIQSVVRQVIHQITPSNPLATINLGSIATVALGSLSSLLYLKK